MSTTDANLLLGDDFFINFGEFAVNVEVAEANCPELFEVLVVCVSFECSEFVDVCPNNNEGVEIPAEIEPLSCDQIDRTTCELFNVDGCCMNACAFELQDLVVCASNSDISCDVPNCDALELEELADISYNTSSTECTRRGGRFSCEHISNFTYPEENGTKMVESTINCAFDPVTGFNISASEDCSCEAALLTSTDSKITQLCGCNLCPSSVPTPLPAEEMPRPNIVPSSSGNQSTASLGPQSSQPTITPSIIASSSNIPASVDEPTAVPTDLVPSHTTLNNTTQTPVDRSASSGNKNNWYEHHASVTVLGAFTSTCLLLCVLVCNKKVNHGGEVGGGDGGKDVMLLT